MVIFTLQSHVKPLAQKLLRVGTQYLVAVRVAVYVGCYKLSPCTVWGRGGLKGKALQILITFGFAMCVLSLSHVYFQCELVRTLIRPDVTRQSAIKRMFVFSFDWWMQTLLHTLLTVCAFEPPGLQALGCPWLRRPPMALSSVLSWPPTPRARVQRCCPKTSAGTAPGCCSKRSTGYVLSFCRPGRGAPRSNSHVSSLATFFLF